ncbi:MAG: hypothetical protein AB1758_38400, partial [Candidatus Eremiobacterota bacterium]
RILLRDFRLTERTPPHEVGHALDFLVERLDPAWHKEWRGRLQQAFDRVEKPNGSKAVTDYSRTNLREYLAEGFAEWHMRPVELKEKDPGLHRAVEELIHKAQELAGRGEPRTLGDFLKRLG